ncbi:hypothetical protein TrRE_jg3808, partial [Triparma retinervis]
MRAGSIHDALASLPSPIHLENIVRLGLTSIKNIVRKEKEREDKHQKDKHKDNTPDNLNDDNLNDDNTLLLSSLPISSTRSSRLRVWSANREAWSAKQDVKDIERAIVIRANIVKGELERTRRKNKRGNQEFVQDKEQDSDETKLSNDVHLNALKDKLVSLSTAHLALKSHSTSSILSSVPSGYRNLPPPRNL